MVCRAQIEFDEQAKAVTSKVTVECSDGSLTNDELLAETKRLFADAQQYALNKSFLRNR